MDIYNAAIKRLMADTRTLLELQNVTGVPYTTIRDIRNGESDPMECKHKTVRQIAKHYFPKLLA